MFHVTLIDKVHQFLKYSCVKMETLQCLKVRQSFYLKNPPMSFLLLILIYFISLMKEGST